MNKLGLFAFFLIILSSSAVMIIASSSVVKAQNYCEYYYKKGTDCRGGTGPLNDWCGHNDNNIYSFCGYFEGSSCSISYYVATTRYYFGCKNCGFAGLGGCCDETTTGSEVCDYGCDASNGQCRPKPGTPILSSPANGAVITTLTPTLTWQSVSNVNVDRYKIFITGPEYGSIFESRSNSLIVPSGKLEWVKTYTWKVAACVLLGLETKCGDWSSQWTFTTPGSCSNNPTGCQSVLDCANGNKCDCNDECNSGNCANGLCAPLLTKSISLSADPTLTPAKGGQTPSTITATTSDGASGITINFITSFGTFYMTGKNTHSCDTGSGECGGDSCSVSLVSSTAGTATVTGSATGYTSGTTTVTFTCAPNWSCTSWSPDVSSKTCGATFTQTRTCTDSNNCGTTSGKPAVSQSATGTACPSGQTCSAGSCVATCTNDCTTSGSKQCSGNGYQTCGNYDSDSCLEWSSVTACPSGQTCSAGSCVATCTESWSCGSWSPAVSSQTCGATFTQTRTCTDANNCGTTVNKPATSQSATGTYCSSGTCSGGTCVSTTCTASLSLSISGTGTCNIAAEMNALNCDGKSWQIKDGGTTKCSSTVLGNSYSATCPTWSVSTGSYTYNLYVDGIIKDSKSVTCPEASQWSITLDATSTSPSVGSSVTLTATANKDVYNSGYSILIYEGSKALNPICGSGTSCSVSVTNSTASTHYYTAKIATYIGSDVQATSNTVSVTWTEVPQKCIDGTPYGQCSSVDANKPSWCNSTGSLIPNQCGSSRHNCPCPSGQSCNTTLGSCYQNCSDGTPYGQCSVTKPKYCDNGNLIDKCTKCYCPSGQTCNSATNKCESGLLPDVVITDIWTSGSTINYIVKNQGAGATGQEIWSWVSIDGAYKTNDLVGSLGPGESATGNGFFGYKWECSGESDTIIVYADYQNHFGESNESNNFRTETFTCSDVSGWSITLSASSNSLSVGSSATLTATANKDVGPTTYDIIIYEGSTIIKTCATGVSCSKTVTKSAPGTNSYTAKVIDAYGYVAQATSNTVTVTFYPLSGCDSYGDLNNDGYVTDVDKTAIQDCYFEKTTCTAEQRLRADVNNDGLVDTGDLTALNRYISGLDATLAACSKTPPCDSYGDLNNNSFVNLRDSKLIADYVVGKISLTEEQKQRADVTGDGKVMGSDALAIGQYMVGIINTFPICDCDQLYNLIIDHFSTACGDANYDKRADVNNDGYVSLADYALFADNYTTSGWCKDRLDGTADPCKTPGCPDINADGVVNVSDVILIDQSMNLCNGQTGYNPKADITGDNCVNNGDMIALNKYFGYSTANIPECKNVPFDFSLSVNPSSGTFTQGRNTQTTVSATLLSGTAQPVSLSYSIHPSATGISVNFNPSSVTPTSAGVSSTMTILTSSSTPVGIYTITVNGTSGSLTKPTTYTLNVNQQPVGCSRANPIVIITPSSQSGLAGSRLEYVVTVANGDSGTDCTRQIFTLTPACPSYWTCSFASSTLSIAPGATNTTTINVTFPSTASGSNSFIVIANSGSYINAASATYVVSTACSRDNPDVIANPSEVSKQAGENHTFTITVTNNDSSTCDKSTFNLTTDCLQGWQCTLNPNSLLISPGSSNSSNLTIKSASTAALGQYLINLTVANRADTKYNATKSIGFIVISKCDGASIKITDAYVYNNSAKVTVENNGTAGNLTITSANITDKSGKIYKPDKLPITNFDVKETEYINFSTAPDCTNVSKVTVATDCPKASASSTDVRCLTTPPTAIVEIVNVIHKNRMVNATLRNIGTEAIGSGSIKILLDGVAVKCKQTFTLAPESSKECDIPDFECSGTAKLEITEPNENETEFECEKTINITAQCCKDVDCNQPLETFTKGEEIYCEVETDPADADVTAKVHNGGTETIDLTEPFKPTETGSYTIELTASKEGYSETTSELSFVVKEAKSGVSPKIIIVILIIVGLAGFIYYRLKKTRKTKTYEKLYEKYGKKKTYEDLYRKYSRNRRYRRRR